MKTDNKIASDRLKALDGLRGIAILLVFFTHIDFYYILSALPAVLRPLGDVLIGSGRTGVSLFFLLSGFLMATYYPTVENKTAFLQKRYTRIFPLFISLVITRTILRANPSISLVSSILALLLPAIFIYFLWVHMVKKINSRKLSLTIFYSFITLQVLMALLYALWIMRNPPVYFNQLLHPLVRESIITFVNATLTLPFGNYIPQLDGVYWSLVSEVLFYILYPILFIPIVQRAKDKSNLFKSLLIVSIIPFLLGLTQLSYRILGYSILDIPYFYFFVVGIGIASLYKNHNEFFNKIYLCFQYPIFKYLPVALFFLLFCVLYFIFRGYSAYSPIIRIISALPFGLVFVFSISKDMSLRRMLESRFLVFLGTISYSMYLVQTSVIDTIKKYIHPTNVLENGLLVLLAFVLICLFSYVTHHLLERPFFVRRKELISKGTEQSSQTKFFPFFPIVVVISVIYLLSVFLAYQSNFNFFSSEYSHSRESAVNLSLSNDQKFISMLKHPTVQFKITARENNLGIVTMDLNYVRHETKKSSNENQLLLFRIKERGSKQWYAESSYKVVEIGNSKQHPFGFPVIVDSRGKRYEIEIELSNPQLPEKMNIGLSDSVVKSVYQVNKSETLRNPSKLIELVLNRFQNVLGNPSAQFAVLLPIPFFIAIGVLLL